jgi:thiamine pyrophosphate-dependent acetolactate synthase large subunit-like protein
MLTPPTASAAPADLIAEAVEILRGAERPVILAGRVSRDLDAWTARIKLAESLGARVVTDLKVGAAFPTDHFLHAGAPGVYAVPDALDAVREADAILSLDWVDLAGILKAASGASAPAATIIQVSLDHQVHNGWSMDHQALPPVDLFLAADPDKVVPAMLDKLGVANDIEWIAQGRQEVLADVDTTIEGPVPVDQLALALRHAVGPRDVSLTHLPLSWNGASWPLRHPLDFLGSDGGGGIGAGPGVTVGAALALRGSGRLAIGICGDGDFLMGATSLWTAVHYRIPLLIVVANNQSFFNDEVHQERVARMRERPVENKWIGQRMSDPDIDLAGLARAQGAAGFGPILKQDELPAIFEQAIKHVELGGVAVVDVRVVAGYTPAMAAGLTRKTG